MLKFVGTIKKIGPVQVISEKFSKREFVLRSLDKFPQDVQFEVTQNGCESLDSFKIGDLVEVAFSLRGREWINPKNEAKYFNTLQVSMISYYSEKKSESYQQRTSTEVNKKHWSGLNGDIAQDMVDKGLENDYSLDNDMPF